MKKAARATNVKPKTITDRWPRPVTSRASSVCSLVSKHIVSQGIYEEVNNNQS